MRGLAWRLALLTFTVPHSGDLEADRERLRRAWKRLRAWLGASIAWRAPRFVLVIEVTQGEDGKGHVHAHVVTWIPFVDYDALHEAWARAIGWTGAPVQAHARDGSPRVNADGTPKLVPSCARPDVQHASVRGAAQYVAKYVAKSAADLPPDLAARWWEASYGKRIVSTSDRFWTAWRTCPDCAVLEPIWHRLAYAAPHECVTWLFDADCPRGPPHKTRETFIGCNGGSDGEKSLPCNAAISPDGLSRSARLRSVDPRSQRHNRGERE